MSRCYASSSSFKEKPREGRGLEVVKGHWEKVAAPIIPQFRTVQLSDCTLLLDSALAVDAMERVICAPPFLKRQT